MSKSNIGQTGPESIRLGGMSIDQLPIAAAAHAKQSMPDFLKSNRQNKIDSIIGAYPKQSVDWIDGAIRECMHNLNNVRLLIAGQNKMINEYMGQISMCKHRDKLLAKTTNKDEIKALKKQFPLYDVKAMKQQVKQCREAINRSDEVIDKEHESIAELRELRAKCVERDEKLAELGALA